MLVATNSVLDWSWRHEDVCRRTAGIMSEPDLDLSTVSYELTQSSGNPLSSSH